MLAEEVRQFFRGDSGAGRFPTPSPLEDVLDSRSHLWIAESAGSCFFIGLAVRSTVHMIVSHLDHRSFPGQGGPAPTSTGN